MGGRSRTRATSGPDVPSVSVRLQGAIAAERQLLERKRDRLAHRRDTVLAELKPIEWAIGEIDRRIELLEALAQDSQRASATSHAASAAQAGSWILRGPAIRETAVKLLAASTATAGPVHYRRVLEIVKDAGYMIAGKEPGAVLLTQLTRSPVIRKAGRPGEYQIDLDAPDRLRARVQLLQAELRWLSDASSGESVIATRSDRHRVVAELGEHEKALEEAIRCLPPGKRQADHRNGRGNLSNPAAITTGPGRTAPPSSGVRETRMAATAARACSGWR